MQTKNPIKIKWTLMKIEEVLLKEKSHILNKNMKKLKQKKKKNKKNLKGNLIKKNNKKHLKFKIFLLQLDNNLNNKLDKLIHKLLIITKMMIQMMKKKNMMKKLRKL